MIYGKFLYFLHRKEDKDGEIEKTTNEFPQDEKKVTKTVKRAAKKPAAKKTAAKKSATKKATKKSPKAE